MKFSAFLVTLIIFFKCAEAQMNQRTRIVTKNVNSMTQYFGNHKIGKTLGVHAEMQMRRHEYFSENLQLLLRTGIDIHLQRLRLTAGYAFVETYPHGEFPVRFSFPEHRTWQQALVNSELGKCRLSHRYRLEQRMIGNPQTGGMGGGRYEHRIRYMVRAVIPLTQNAYVSLYDEVFVNFGRQVAYNVFDQNRLYGAIGRKLATHVKIEVGYMLQYLQQRRLIATSGIPQTIMEANHCLQFAVFADFPLFNQKKNADN